VSGLVAITGGTGHIGNNLTRALIAERRRLRLLIYTEPQGLDGLDFERVAGDVLDPASLDRAFDGAEVVYHVAGRISIYRDAALVHKVNVLGTRNVVEACLRAKVSRLVHVSSVHAFTQEPFNEPIRESHPLVTDRRALPYDRSKADGEREIQAGIAKGLDATIVNPSGVIGPYDFAPSRMGDMLLRLAKRSLPGLMRAGYDFVDVRDVVAGAIAAETRGRTGQHYLLTGAYVSLEELAALASGLTGTPAPRIVSPIWLSRFGVPFMTLWAFLTKTQPLVTQESISILAGNGHFRHDLAAEELGYKARPLVETLSDTYAWFRSQGLLPELSPALLTS